MADPEDQDKSEPATAYKLQKSREKGQVAKSSEMASAIVVLAGMTFMGASAWAVTGQWFRWGRSLISGVGSVSSQAFDPWRLVAELLVSLSGWVLPFGGLLMAVAILGSWVQTGPVFAPSLASIDLNRINPVQSLKRLLSARFVFELFRLMLKLAVVSLAMTLVLHGLSSSLAELSFMSAGYFGKTLLDSAAHLGIKLGCLLVGVAFLDVLFARREFAKKMRMSRRELKDEIKQRDGDPRIRARLRELRQQARRRSMTLSQTRHADVVVTNPVHVAVALRYVHGQMDAPLVVAKGAGLVAAVMRRLAARHHVPVVRSPALARKLYAQLEVDHAVPPWLFAEVARIMVWILAMRERSAAQMSDGVRA